MNELEIEVFRSGDYGEKGAFSEKDVDQLISDYDPSVHEAHEIILVLITPCKSMNFSNGPSFFRSL